MKKRILCIPTENHMLRVFSDKTLERLRSRFDVTLNERGRNYTSQEVAEGIRGYDGLITGWGSPPLVESVFENADHLRIIAHSAGSVKFMLSKEVVERYILPRKICVCNANKAISYNVAEATIGLLIMASRRFVDHIVSMREKSAWQDASIPLDVQTLNGSVVGIVSASTVGREVIRLLRPFRTRILVHDPYLSEREAKRLNVEKTSLEDLFRRSDFVTIHAPLTEKTVHMIDERHLRLLRDGAVLVNTSRGRVIDYDALLEECKTRRIMVALDVTDPEPLPSDSPFRKLRNVLTTPHITGCGRYGYYKICDMTVQALEGFFKGRKVGNAIDFRKYDVIA